MTSATPSKVRRSLRDLLAEIDDEDPEGSFLRSILRSAETQDPQLPDLIRAAAIPRSLTPEIIGLLRGAPDDAAGNERYLRMLADYRFVLHRADGGLVYHDNTRDALLADWKSSEEKQDRFVTLNRTLADHHEARYGADSRADRRLNLVAPVVGKANPGRLARLTAAIEGNMTSALLEALYHHLLAGTRDGVDFFRSSFHRLEGANRLGICRSLVSFCQDFLRRLPDDERDPVQLAWLDYFDARVTRQTPPYDYGQAENLLGRLLDTDGLPPDLVTWALDDLALVFQARMKMDDALRTRRELVEQRSGVDVYNDPLRASNLANLYWVLGDRQHAVKQFLVAIDKADSLPGARLDLAVLARLDLSGVYAELADWPAGFEAAVEGYYRARTSFRSDPLVQQVAATGMARLLAAFDPRASDCAAREASGYPDAKSEQWAYAVLDHVELLGTSGRVATARALLDQLASELDAGAADAPLRLDLDFRQALLHGRVGQEAAADAIYASLVERTAGRLGTRWTHLAARANRGRLRSQLGDATGAIEELTAAREQWLASGCDLIAASITVDIASARARMGDLNAAAAAFASADGDLPHETGRDRMSLLLDKGDLAERLGDWAGAQECYQQAHAMAAALHHWTGQATLLRKLAGVHAERADWFASASYHRQASVLSEQLGTADVVADSDIERRVGAANAEAMSRFVEAECPTSLDQARAVLQTAVDGAPDNLWPRLNLSFLCAEQQDWQDAVDALARVLDLCPAPMRTTRLYRCLRDYTLAHANGLRQRGNLSKATAVVTAALERVSDRLPAAELAELHAVRGGLLALAGTPGAQAGYRAALGYLARDDGGEPPSEVFARHLAAVFDSGGQYSAVDASLRQLQADPAAPAAVRNTVAESRNWLGSRLDQILGAAPAVPDTPLPVVTPIVVEVGNDLVPIVDSKSDGGVFLFELIPAMRDRIAAGTGVRVPGVRMRGSTTLGSREFLVRVDEVPVVDGAVDPHGWYVIRSLADVPVPAGAELTDVHPLTGEPGVGVIGASLDGQPAGDGTMLTGAQYLIHLMERAIRTHLPRLFGVQETASLLETWSEAAGDLVGTVVSDEPARLRLTWLLQALLEEGVPVTGGTAVLDAVRAAGGLGVPLDTLNAAVRLRLRDQLPGPRTGRTAVPVPAELEAALLGRPDAAPLAGNSGRHEFRVWLRARLAEAGPAITLVTASDGARRLVSVLARAQHGLVTTLSRAELG